MWRPPDGVVVLARVITDLEGRGCVRDGQIAATRSAGRAITKVARARHVCSVVMDTRPATGVRRVIEGELTDIVWRRLRDGATLDLVPARH